MDHLLPMDHPVLIDHLVPMDYGLLHLIHQANMDPLLGLDPLQNMDLHLSSVSLGYQYFRTNKTA